MMPIRRDAVQLGSIVVLAAAASLSPLVGTSGAVADVVRRSDRLEVYTAHARECPSARGNSFQLCLPGQPVSRTAVETMSRMLNNASDKVTLCAVDAIVIRSEIVCQADELVPPDPFNALPPPESDQLRNLDGDLLLADLMTKLAKAWGRHGNPERAAELFQGADQLAALHEDYVPLARHSLLKEWLAFETGRGQLEQALSVARALAASHRHMLEQSSLWPTTDLVESLKTEADFLDRLGRHDEAEERRREADSLTAE
ncbi:MAG: hypothetical protein ACKVOI_02460 [Dongiaceae bacterium]